MSSPTLVLYFCLHKCDNVFLFILSRTKGTFTGETERENQSCTISVETRTPLCHFPLFGFGLLIEFEDVQRLANGHVDILLNSSILVLFGSTEAHFSFL
nr:unnamed protein product [Brassica rapa]